MNNYIFETVEDNEGNIKTMRLGFSNLIKAFPVFML
jgi:hypothetical protein